MKDIEDFLTWLEWQGINLAKWDSHNGLVALHDSNEEWITKYKEHCDEQDEKERLNTELGEDEFTDNIPYADTRVEIRKAYEIPPLTEEQIKMNRNCC